MDPLNIKEKINKIRCIADRVKYSREKHFYQIVFGLLVFKNGYKEERKYP